MLPEDKKRKMRFSVISMLRENGMPMRSENDEEEQDDRMLLASNEETPEEAKARKEEEEKKRKREQEQKRRLPNPSPEGVNVMKNAFRKQI